MYMYITLHETHILHIDDYVAYRLTGTRGGGIGWVGIQIGKSKMKNQR